MSLEDITAIGLCLALLALVAEYVDSTLGMGFGTTLTPVLLLMGYEPMQVVPAVLLSEVLTGLFAGMAHHIAGNASFRIKWGGPRKTASYVRQLGIAASFKKSVSEDLKVALVIATCGVLGTIVGLFAALKVNPFFLKLYIGVMVLSVGIMIVFRGRKIRAFSWRRLTGISLVAAFNKSLSGGGYGPLVTGGQILSGVEGKNAVAVTSLAESLTCAVGFLGYLLAARVNDLSLFPYVCGGALLSVPLSAMTVKKSNTNHLKMAIGLLTTVLGVLTLLKLLV